MVLKNQLYAEGNVLALHADNKDVPCERKWGRSYLLDGSYYTRTEKLPWTFKILKQVRSNIDPPVFVIHSNLST